MKTNKTNDKPHVLVSNDDGIDAPGIQALCQALMPIARVSLVAPARERSAAGHSISVFNDIHLSEREYENGLRGFALDGTPADCVKWAISSHLADDRPDIVISGINRGQNAGNNIIYSGTVAAAREGAMFDIPSIAVSLAVNYKDEPHFETAARFTASLLPLALEIGMPPGVLLNVNVPNVPESELKGVEVSRMGKAMFLDEFEIQGERAEFMAIRNIGKKFVSSEDHQHDVDDVVLYANKISITPLQYDLTHHSYREELERWLKQRLETDASEKIRRVADDISEKLGKTSYKR